MPNKVIEEPIPQENKIPPKKMKNSEIWLKILADQKLIREELQNGLSLQEIEQKHGFRFARL